MNKHLQKYLQLHLGSLVNNPVRHQSLNLPGPLFLPLFYWITWSLKPPLNMKLYDSLIVRKGPVQEEEGWGQCNLPGVYRCALRGLEPSKGNAENDVSSYWKFILWVHMRFLWILDGIGNLPNLPATGCGTKKSGYGELSPTGDCVHTGGNLKVLFGLLQMVQYKIQRQKGQPVENAAKASKGFVL